MATINAKQDHDPQLEVVTAYNEVLNKLTKRMNAPEIKMQEKKEEEKIELLKKVADETPDNLASFFTNFKNTFMHFVKKLEDEFSHSQQRLANLNQTSELRTQEIADLYEIKVHADTLKALMMAQEDQKQQFELHMKEQRQLFEQEMIQKKRDYQLEEQKYTHQRDLAREKERNLELASTRNLDRELAAKRLEFERMCEDRESKIAAQEQEFQLLQERVANFPEELQRAAKKAEEMVTKQLTMQFNYEAQLLQKEIKLYEQTIATLEAKIAHFESFKNSLNQLSFGVKNFGQNLMERDRVNGGEE